MKWAVFGLGRSGSAVANDLLLRNEHVTIYDAGHVDRAGFESRGAEVFDHWQHRFDPAKTDIVVVNPAIDQRHPALVRAVTDGIEVVSEIEYAYRISKAPIIAVTGTNGKSTTVVMTYLALMSAGIDARLCGNIYGTGYPETTLTEAAVDATPDHVLVAEISSFQLEWIQSFKPRCAAITNATQDHLERYSSNQEYIATKARIFENMGRGDTFVVNLGAPMPPLGRINQHLNLITFPNLENDVSEVDRFTVLGQNYEKSEFNIFGTYNFENCLMAVLLAKAYCDSVGKDVETEDLVRPFRDFRGLDHRMEVVGEKGSILVINSSMSTNPNAVISNSESIARPQRILIGGVNKELSFQPLRDYLQNSDHHVYLFGRDARPINIELDGRWPIFNTMAEAFERAIRDSNEGDVILLAPGCASKDQFNDFRDRGNQFKEIATKWLNL